MSHSNQEEANVFLQPLFIKIILPFKMICPVKLAA